MTPHLLRRFSLFAEERSQPFFCPESRSWTKNWTEFSYLLETENWAFLVWKNGISEINGRDFGICIKIDKITDVFTKTIHFKEIFFCLSDMMEIEIKFDEMAELKTP